MLTLFVIEYFFYLAKKNLQLYPVAVYSKNSNYVKYDNKIYNQKLLAMIECFE